MVLITGFEPFGGLNRNLSAEVAREVSLRMPCAKAEILPVSFKRAQVLIEKVIDADKPEALILLGYAPKRTKVSVERIAINLMDSLSQDNDGIVQTEAMVDSDGEQAYFSNTRVREIATAIQFVGIDAAVSNSAGLYVCNALYYRALHFIQKNKLNIKAVFIHLPEMPLADATKAVAVVVETIMKQC